MPWELAAAAADSAGDDAQGGVTAARPVPSATDRLLQGNDRHPHQPVGTRQTPCVICHTDGNFTLHERASYRSISGHPRWMAAPIEMA
jgi:hypothetical protein